MLVASLTRGSGRAPDWISMPDFIVFFFAAIVTLRLTLLISESEILRPARLWLLGGGPAHGPGAPWMILGRAASCPFCASWHVSALVVLGAYLTDQTDPLGAAVLCLSSGILVDVLLALRPARPLLGGNSFVLGTTTTHVTR